MKDRKEYVDSLEWTIWGIASLFLVFVLGWFLTGCLVIPLIGALNQQLPVWLKVLLGLGSPVLGGVAAVLLWWRFGRIAVGRVARALGIRRKSAASWPGGLRWFLLVCVAMTVIGLLPMGYGLNEFTYHRWLGSFHPAEATVTGTRIDDVERAGLKGLAPRALYEFRVNGKVYLGYKIHWELHLPDEGGPPPTDSVIWSRDEAHRKTLQSLLHRYHVGKKVTAYVDPADPTNACLIYVPFKPNEHGSGLWFVLGFLVLLWSIYVVAWQLVTRRLAK